MKKKLTATGKFSPKNVLSKSELKQILGGTGGPQAVCSDKDKKGSVSSDPFSGPSGAC